jgi:hypothetical protein
VSTKLGSRTSGASDSGGEGGGVRRACVLVSSGLAGRSFTPGTYRINGQKQRVDMIPKKYLL